MLEVAAVGGDTKSSKKALDLCAALGRPVLLLSPTADGKLSGLAAVPQENDKQPIKANEWLAAALAAAGGRGGGQAAAAQGTAPKASGLGAAMAAAESFAKQALTP